MSGLPGFDTSLDPVVVFDEGDDGYHTLRIPALVRTQDDVLLAFAEARRDSQRDDGHIALVVRRSRDLGRTWGAMQVLAVEDGPVTMGNPCPFVERRTGDVVLLHTRSNKRAFRLRSADGGETFGPAEEITDVCRGFDYPWVRIATGPVHGVQLASGRLLAPAWLGGKEIRDPASVYRSCALLSDDGGRTWRPGGVAGDDALSPNECTAYERADGIVVLNMRARQGERRLVSESDDGGESFSPPRPDEALPAPPCQGATLMLPEADGARRLLFSDILPWREGLPEPADGAKRSRLTVRLSRDEGRTWPAARCITEGPAGYADMVALPDGEVGMLCECGERRYNQRLAFVRFTPEWIAS